MAGFSEGAAFIRSPDNAFILLPNGRLQLDAYGYHSANKTPNPTALIRRARLELAGWIGAWAFFSVAGDFGSGPPSTTAAPALQSNLLTTDDFIAIAPLENLVILQVGQFDAPFTLENRTSDKYFDFMERSVTVRAFGIPDNKEIGVMLHGYNEDKTFYYSLGVFNGDSQNFKNVDNNLDWMGRGWVAPFPKGSLHEVEMGASGWTGARSSGLAPAAQTTQGGFAFFPTATFNTVGPGTTAIIPVQLRQQGRLNAFAVELNAPIDHRYGARGELVWKHQALSEENVTTPAAPVPVLASQLRGWSAYGELWFWFLGDDRLLGDQQGLEPFARYKKFGIRLPQRGLMAAFRFEHLDEVLQDDPAAMPLLPANPSAGRTKVTVYELGVNYWFSKRYRATANYLFNHFTGDTRAMQALSSRNVQEFLFRFAIAL